MTIKITLLALTFAAFGFSSCQQNHQADVAVKENGLIFDTLSYETALRYVKNYESHAGTVDSGLVGKQAVGQIHQKPNTRCVWFSLARLDSVVQKTRREGGDGVRFYLASYDRNYGSDFKGGHKPDKQFWGSTTLVMVSTKDSVVKPYHQDYYYKKPAAGQNGGLQGFIIGNAPENRGEQCPPPNTCSSIGATLVK